MAPKKSGSRVHADDTEPTALAAPSPDTPRSLRITLHFSPNVLARFPYRVNADAPKEEKEEDMEENQTVAGEQQNNNNADIEGSGQSTATATPIGGNSWEVAPKPRGRPGPKPGLKKKKLGDPSNPSELTRSLAGQSRSGPKANQGAINAGLRALDRSGKPCRKWDRRALQIRSFTGTVWELDTWRAPKRASDIEAEKEQAEERMKNEQMEGFDSGFISIAASTVAPTAVASPIPV